MRRVPSLDTIVIHFLVSHFPLCCPCHLAFHCAIRMALLLFLPLLSLLSVLLPVDGQPTITTSASSPPLNFRYSHPFLFTSPFDNVTYDFNSSTLPPSGLAREGSLYASEGEVFMYWGGGVHLGVAFSDMWLIDTLHDTFTPCPVLPNPLYYSSAQWCELLESMVVYTGQTSQPGATPTYLQSVLLFNLVNASAASCAPAVTQLSMTSTPGRVYAATVLVQTVLYVFGGYNAVQALTPATSFFAIDLVANVTIPLSNGISANFPPGVVGPAMMVDAAQRFIYVYGGLTAPLATGVGSLVSTALMYRFDVERGLWLTPIVPFIASNSAVVTAFPPLALTCFTPADPAGEAYVFFGGTDGYNNSLDTIVLVDLTTDAIPGVGVPTVSVLYTTLPWGVQGCAMGRNQLQELMLLTGLSVGIDALFGTYPTGIVESTLPLLASNYPVDTYSTFLPAQDTTGEWAVTGPPLPREGAVYGSDGTLIYMAGGVVLTSTSILALSDVWVLNTTADAYIATAATLPVGLYYAVGEWYGAQRAMYVWGGRVSTQGNGVTNAYSAALYKIDLTSPTSPIVTTITLSSNLTLKGTQFSSSALVGSSLYIFGGMTGANGSVAVAAQQFFSISLLTFTVTKLPTTNSSYDWFPSNTWITPALFSQGTRLYVYSGLGADYATWADSSRVYVYDTLGIQWLGDLSVVLSPYTSLPSQWPNLAFASRAYSTDGLHAIYAGGTFGDRSVNGAGSHSRIVHIDLSQLAVSGSPLVSVLPSSLLQAVQSPVVGLTAGNAALFVWGGVTYLTTAQLYPLSYSRLMQEVLQTGWESTSVYASTFYINPTPVTVQSMTNTTMTSVSALSGGQVFGIVVGAVAFMVAVLWCGVLVVTGRWRRLNQPSSEVWLSGQQWEPKVARLPRSPERKRRSAAPAGVAEEEDGALDEEVE